MIIQLRRSTFRLSVLSAALLIRCGIKAAPGKYRLARADTIVFHPATESLTESDRGGVWHEADVLHREVGNHVTPLALRAFARRCNKAYIDAHQYTYLDAVMLSVQWSSEHGDASVPAIIS